MSELARSRFPRTLLCCVLVVSWMPPLAFAQETPQRPAAAAATADSGAPLSSQLDRSRELLKDGNYDDAIEILKPLIAREPAHPDSLADVYLLLIKTYVFIGNDNRFKPQGRESPVSITRRPRSSSRSVWGSGRCATPAPSPPRNIRKR